MKTFNELKIGDSYYRISKGEKKLYKLKVVGVRTGGQTKTIIGYSDRDKTYAFTDFHINNTQPVILSATGCFMDFIDVNLIPQLCDF